MEFVGCIPVSCKVDTLVDDVKATTYLKIHFRGFMRPRKLNKCHWTLFKALKNGPIAAARKMKIIVPGYVCINCDQQTVPEEQAEIQHTYI